MRAVVEVHRLMIVNGPGATKWLEAALFLLDESLLAKQGASGKKVFFTVTTPASPTPFEAHVTILCMSQQAFNSYQVCNSGDFYFSGIYQGKLIEGLHSLKTKSGKLDEL